VQCDRALPCKECVRRGRQEACHKNPSPAVMGISGGLRRLVPRDSPGGVHVQHSLPSTPNTSGASSHSSAAQERQQMELGVSSSANEVTLTPTELRRESELQTFCAQYGRAPPQAARTMCDTRIQNQPTVDEVKIQLAKTIPNQEQCDNLVSHYLDHLDCLYRPIHVPLFRRQHVEFWETPLSEIDLSWFALFLAILSVSSALESSDTEQCSSNKYPCQREALFRASELALHTSERESRPQLAHIQTFLVSQIHWIGIQDTDSMNSSLGKVVRQAQTLGLHKPCTSSNLLEREMRHRIWWEICHADTYVY
jgi:hypothetical protein